MPQVVISVPLFVNLNSTDISLLPWLIAAFCAFRITSGIIAKFSSSHFAVFHLHMPFALHFRQSIQKHFAWSQTFILVSQILWIVWYIFKLIGWIHSVSCIIILFTILWWLYIFIFTFPYVYVLAYDDTPLIPILHLSFLFSLDFYLQAIGFCSIRLLPL